MPAADGQSWEANFVRNLERRRKAAALTQTDLARQLRDRYELPFHQQTIDRIESGKRPVRLDEAHQIADFFRTTVVELTKPPNDAELVDLRRDVGRAASGIFRAVKAFRRTQDALRAAYQDADVTDSELEKDVRVALSWTVERLVQIGLSSYDDQESIRAARRTSKAESDQEVRDTVEHAFDVDLSNVVVQIVDDSETTEKSRSARRK